MSLSAISGYVQYMKRRGFTQGTVTGREGALRAFAAWLHPRVILDASSSDIDLFLDTRKARTHNGPISSRTRYGWVSSLHSFYGWAIAHDVTDRDPTRTIDRPKLPRKLPRPISEADLTVALQCADRMMYVWLMLAAYAGLRCMEIGAMDVDWILIDGAIVVLQITGKGNKQRMVPCHPLLVDALDAWGLPKSGPVFTRPRGGRWPAHEVSREGNYFLSGLGIKATMHMCRHRFGTQAYKACRDLRLVQELMGHSTPSVTAGYVAISNLDARNAVLALPALTGN